MTLYRTVALTLAAVVGLGGFVAGAQSVNPFIGNWEGSFSTADESGEATAIIIGLGDHYELRLTLDEYTLHLNGQGHEEMAAFQGIDGPEDLQHIITAEIMDGELAGRIMGPEYSGDFSLERVFHRPESLGAEPPEDAVLLFDGSDTDQWVRHPETWPVSNGAMQVGGSNLKTREEFGDHRIHLEFRTPYMPNAQGQGRGNSGVYIHGRYELQVLDSFGEEPADNFCGGFYNLRAPNENASLPPGEWQTYDITFHAPHFDEDGEKVENARVTVVHNGTVIHDDYELPEATPGGLTTEEGEEGPLWLQDHSDSVQYRNIWVERL
ncbi:MAG: DUF1080 domain-containing protein [Candidatus Hydrogenedentota bacterium]